MIMSFALPAPFRLCFLLNDGDAISAARAYLDASFLRVTTRVPPIEAASVRAAQRASYAFWLMYLSLTMNTK